MIVTSPLVQPQIRRQESVCWFIGGGGVGVQQPAFESGLHFSSRVECGDQSSEFQIDLIKSCVLGVKPLVDSGKPLPVRVGRNS